MAYLASRTTQPVPFSGGSMGGARGTPPPPHFFLDQTEARRAEKNFVGDRLPPPPLSQGLDPAVPFASVLSFLCVVTQRFFHKRLYMFLGRSVE